MLGITGGAKLLNIKGAACDQGSRQRQMAAAPFWGLAIVDPPWGTQLQAWPVVGRFFWRADLRSLEPRVRSRGRRLCSPPAVPALPFHGPAGYESGDQP